MADKEWTVMFFFAGDNSLSPLIVSQLKALKDAGFHPDVDILAHFDSNEVGVPTKIFDVNRRRKHDAQAHGRRAQVGDGRDSFVRDLTDDVVLPEELSSDKRTATGKLRATLERADRSNAADALRNFLGFCRENHRAKNYILVLVGHGLVVGNDAFLPDSNPVSAITLEELQRILDGFTRYIKEDESEGNPEGILQLLALHSCAMSAVEVAYQLKGTARFMIGSEGVSFIDSWPYRQLLKRILNFVDRARGGEAKREDDKVAEFDGKPGEARREDNELTEVIERPSNAHADDPRDLIERLYFHSLFNATDFMLSGYSLDLSLCNLDPDNFDSLTDKIGVLVSRLKSALDDERRKELILLAHWESQSYWEESYTDLYDFCFCLRKRCRLALGLPKEKEYGNRYEKTEGSGEEELKQLADACTDVMAELDRKRSKKLEERFSKIVVHSCHFGPEYQYSHGLSVYFPWSRPLDDDPPTNVPQSLQARQNEPGIDSEGILARYGNYVFNQELRKRNKDESWFDFLESYFEKTQRKPRREEEGRAGMESDEASIESDKAIGSRVRGFFNHFGVQSNNPFPTLSKESPRVARESPRTGESCTCPSIKNYPTDTITTPRGEGRHVSLVTASKVVLRRFRQTE
jgi:Clostripain family